MVNYRKMLTDILSVRLESTDSCGAFFLRVLLFILFYFFDREKYFSSKEETVQIHRVRLD